ncbi:hypothetical protein B0H10DRAFT_2208190 [Mycena sp. CBHHK59/15]|nr:hypothetical protein B0H10DRAFT_2208190 [Mycena sp. CBHHK59/15]
MPFVNKSSSSGLVLALQLFDAPPAEPHIICGPSSTCSLIAVDADCGHPSAPSPSSNPRSRPRSVISLCPLQLLAVPPPCALPSPLMPTVALKSRSRSRGSILLRPASAVVPFNHNCAARCPSSPRSPIAVDTHCSHLSVPATLPNSFAGGFTCLYLTESSIRRRIHCTVQPRILAVAFPSTSPSQFTSTSPFWPLPTPFPTSIVARCLSPLRSALCFTIPFDHSCRYVHLVFPPQCFSSSRRWSLHFPTAVHTHCLLQLLPAAHLPALPDTVPLFILTTLTSDDHHRSSLLPRLALPVSRLPSLNQCSSNSPRAASAVPYHCTPNHNGRSLPSLIPALSVLKAAQFQLTVPVAFPCASPLPFMHHALS